MKYIKLFNEMKYQDKFDYDRIISILKNSHGWGFGVISSIDSFEDSEEYFLDPQDNNDYAEQFHIYLTDMETGQLRGRFNNKTSLKNQSVDYPSFYNKLT